MKIKKVLKKSSEYQKLETKYIASKNKQKKLGMRIWQYRKRIYALIEENEQLKHQVNELNKKLNRSEKKQ